MGIVIDGLIGYWSSKQGVSGSTWENIAPDTKGKHNGVIKGATLQNGGLYFDGVDDTVLIEKITNASPSIAVEIYYYHDILGSSVGGYPFNVYKDTNFRMFSQKHTDAAYANFGDATTSKAFNSLTTAKEIIKNLQLHHVVHQYNAVTQKKELYVNGRLDASVAISRDYKDTFDFSIGCNRYAASYSGYMRGNYAYVRLYSKALSVEEIAKNIAVGKEIGLSESINETPKVTVISTEHYKVSKITGFDVSILEFSFDTDVTEWKVVLLGVSYNTGTLLDSGGLTLSGKNIFSVIYGNKLYQEGQNRINIYGKNETGWTNYSS